MKHEKKTMVVCPDCGLNYNVDREQAPEHRRRTCIECSQSKKTIPIKKLSPSREQPQERIHE